MTQGFSLDQYQDAFKNICMKCFSTVAKYLQKHLLQTCLFFVMQFLHPKKKNYATKAMQNLFKSRVILEIRIPAALAPMIQNKIYVTWLMISRHLTWIKLCLKVKCKKKWPASTDTQYSHLKHASGNCGSQKTEPEIHLA